MAADSSMIVTTRCDNSGGKIPGWFKWLLGIALPLALLLGGFVWYLDYDFNKRCVPILGTNDLAGAEKCFRIIDNAGIRVKNRHKQETVCRPLVLHGEIVGEDLLEYSLADVMILPEDVENTFITLAEANFYSNDLASITDMLSQCKLIPPDLDNKYSTTIQIQKAIPGIVSQVISRHKDIESANVNYHSRVCGEIKEPDGNGVEIKLIVDVDLNLGKGCRLDRKIACCVYRLVLYQYKGLFAENITISDQHGNTYNCKDFERKQEYPERP